MIYSVKGSAIKALRKTNNLTQKELAEQMDCSLSSVRRWEEDSNLSDITLIIKLSELYSVPINDLLNEPIPSHVLPKRVVQKKQNRKVQIAKRYINLGITAFVVSFICFTVFNLVNEFYTASKNLYSKTKILSESFDIGNLFSFIAMSSLTATMLALLIFLIVRLYKRKELWSGQCIRAALFYTSYSIVAFHVLIWTPFIFITLFIQSHAVSTSFAFNWRSIYLYTMLIGLIFGGIGALVQYIKQKRK